MTVNTPGTGNANDPGATQDEKPSGVTMQDAENYQEKTGGREAWPEEIAEDKAVEEGSSAGEPEKAADVHGEASESSLETADDVDSDVNDESGDE